MKASPLFFVFLIFCFVVFSVPVEKAPQTVNSSDSSSSKTVDTITIETETSSEYDCSIFSSCKDCDKKSDQNCGWCGRLQQCLSITNKTACGSSTKNSCWKPTASDCPSKVCGKMTDCLSCVNAGCGWYAGTETCVEETVSSTGGDPVPCYLPNDYDDDCFKFAAKECPAVLCSDLDGNCSACSDTDGCAYCAYSNECLELNYQGNSPCNDQCQDQWNQCFCNDTNCVHGDCDEQDEICSCDEDWYGLVCNTFCDPAINCSRHGQCSDDGSTCICNAGYSGDDCGVSNATQCSQLDDCEFCDSLDGCVWCETNNSCQNATMNQPCDIDFNTTSDCSASCSVLSDNDCLDDCGCYWCNTTSLCQYYTGSTSDIVCEEYTRCSGGLSGGIIALIVIVVLLVSCCLGFIAFKLYKNYERSKYQVL